MSKKELVVLWVIGICTAFFITLGIIYPENKPAWEVCLKKGRSPDVRTMADYGHKKIEVYPTREVFTFLIPAWILGGLFFITFRNTRKKQEREKRDNL